MQNERRSTRLGILTVVAMADDGNSRASAISRIPTKEMSRDAR